jgi:uncharacterized protein DUF4190
MVPQTATSRSRRAVVSAVTGVVAVLAFALAGAIPLAYPPPTGTRSAVWSPAFPLVLVLMFVAMLLSLVAIYTGVGAVRRIKAGTQSGKGLAWFGLLCGGAFVALVVLVGLPFLLLLLWLPQPGSR